MAMRDRLIEQDDASTPLTNDERQGLIPSYITLRRELNEAEQMGILAAQQWAFARKRMVLDEKFLRDLHRRMFSKVWKWAGTFRNSPRNIGVDHWLIPIELRNLLDDARYWVEHATYPPDETAARFHHRLVWIHPFPNGNGRHARLAADLLAVQLGRKPFSWGRANLAAAGDVRRRYIEALRAADEHQMEALFTFVRRRG
jgi:Fic-DOC domain mobile mystery protein B